MVKLNLKYDDTLKNEDQNRYHQQHEKYSQTLNKVRKKQMKVEDMEE